MKVAEIMKHPAAAIPASAGIIAAASMMRDRGVGLLVVLENDAVVGVITDRDITVRWVTGGALAREARVADIMSADVRTCYDWQTIEAAAAIMADHQIRRLPVCDSAGRLVGLLSVDDIAEDFSEHLAGEVLGEIVERRSLPPPVDLQD